MYKFNDNETINIIRTSAVNEKVIAKLKSVKKAIGSMDIGCRFDNNECAGCKVFKTPAFCCEGCASMNGYLSVIPSNDMRIYIKSFNGNTGFWRPNVGCVLPHELRSRMCLSFICTDLLSLRKEIFKEIKENVILIHKIEKDLKIW
jgi:hypothetical protein